MQTNILGGGGVVILPTQQISETFQREVRINHWIKYQGGFGDLYVGSYQWSQNPHWSGFKREK